MSGTQISLEDEVPVSIRRLATGQIARAFPLLRDAGRCDSLADWCDYALVFIGEVPDSGTSPSGIIVAEQSNRCIVGLYSYVVRPSLRAGRVLSVGDLTVMAPFAKDVIAERLLASAAELAKAQRIRELEISLASASGWWAPLLAKRGFVLDDRRQVVWRRAASRTGNVVSIPVPATPEA